METRSFLTLEGASREDLREVLDLARACAQGHVGNILAGQTVCLAFFEASTRTAVSFELAAKRSGADVISLSEKGSAIAKGESLIDTVVTLDREDPGLTVPLTHARPRRSAALKGDIYRTRAVTDPRSTDRTSL